MGALNDDDMRTFVGSACDGPLLGRRRQNFLTSREPSLSLSWTEERLDVTAHVGVASRSRCALPLLQVTLGHEVDMPVSSLSAPPSVRVLDFGGLPLVIHAQADSFCR